MGNSSARRSASLKNLFPNFRIDDWELLNERDTSQRNGIYGNFNTYRNLITGEEIDRYELFFSNEKEKRIYEQCFVERLREDYLVNAYHYDPLVSGGFCSITLAALVYIQHIPVRLSDITDIPFPENLYILKCCLLGF